MEEYYMLQRKVNNFTYVKDRQLQRKMETSIEMKDLLVSLGF